MSEPTGKKEGDVYEVPPLGSVMAFRGVHALSEIAPTGYLRATHYATCLVGGPTPTWGVWSVNGVFQRFFGSKAQVAEAYPRKVWRLRSATWNLIDIAKRDAAEKKAIIHEIYKKGVNLAHEPVGVLFEDGTLLTWAKRHSRRGNYRTLYAGPEENRDNVVQLADKRSAAV